MDSTARQSAGHDVGDRSDFGLANSRLEIEADSVGEVLQVAALLGYDRDGLASENTTKIYQRYGIDLATHKELRLR